MAVVNCISEELSKQILDAYHQFARLEEQYDDDCKPDTNLYRHIYDEHVGKFLKQFVSPTLHIPDEAIISLVSIGDYSREDYWSCSTFNLLVDDERAEEMLRFGKDALEGCYEQDDFFKVLLADYDDIVRLKVYGYALEHGITIYREFHDTYGQKCPSMLYEQFIPDYS